MTTNHQRAARTESSELRLADFDIAGPPLGCDGARLQRVAANHFRLTLAAAPGHPEWANWLRFTILRSARGRRLRLDVAFDHPEPVYAFTAYAPCWSCDGETWSYVPWEGGFTKGRAGTLLFPPFPADRVMVSTQLPMLLEEHERLVQRWGRHPHCRVHRLGASVEGRDLYRLEVTDPASPHPPSERWVHHFANQHCGEGVAQWYVAGALEWLFSDEAAAHRRRTIAHFTPMMNPDGVAHGWCRVNAEGFDMNRTYRVEGAEAGEQAREAFIFQRDLETLMRSEAPVTTSWSVHSWRSKQLEPIVMGQGPELGGTVGTWEDLDRAVRKRDPRNLVKPMRAHDEPTPPNFWDAGPYRQFGITNMLIEGGGGELDKQECLEAGAALMRGVVEHYHGIRPRA